MAVMTGKNFDDHMGDIESAVIRIAEANATCKGCGQRIESLDHALNELGRVRSVSREWRQTVMATIEDAHEIQAENERLALDNRRLTEMWDTDRESLNAEIERLRAEIADLLPRMDADAMTISNMSREIERLRAAMQEALGGADCETDHGMPDLCGWCILREALGGTCR